MVLKISRNEWLDYPFYWNTTGIWTVIRNKIVDNFELIKEEQEIFLEFLNSALTKFLFRYTAECNF